MSAFVVDKTHIDALITAGLFWNPSSSKLTWFHTPITEEDRRESSTPGVAITGEDIELAQKRRRELTDESAGRVGAMLLAENRRSVDFRYNEEEWEEPYVFEHLGVNIDPVVVLDAISCYEYQSCEHPEWINSEAKQFCDSLRMNAIRHLPRKSGSVWEITDPKVFGNKVTRIC